MLWVKNCETERQNNSERMQKTKGKYPIRLEKYKKKVRKKNKREGKKKKRTNARAGLKNVLTVACNAQLRDTYVSYKEQTGSGRSLHKDSNLWEPMETNGAASAAVSGVFGWSNQSCAKGPQLSRCYNSTLQRCTCD